MSREAVGRICALAICGLTLLSCATPVTYGPIGATGFGYSDARNADGSYTVRVVSVSQAQAHEFWDRRATELCGGADYRKNIFRAEIPVVSYSGYASGPNGYGGSYTEDRYGALVLEGYVHCATEAQTIEPGQQPDAPPAIDETAAVGAPSP